MPQFDTASTTSTLVNPTSAKRTEKAHNHTKAYTTQRDANISYRVCKAQEAAQLSYMHIYDRGNARNIVARYDSSEFDADEPITSTTYMDPWSKEKLCDCVQVSDQTVKFTVGDLATYLEIKGDNELFAFCLFDKTPITINVQGKQYDAKDNSGFVYASCRQSLKHAVPLMGQKFATMDLHQVDDIEEGNMTLLIAVMLYVEARLRNLHVLVRMAKRRNMKTSGDTSLFMGGQNWAEQYGDKAVKN